MVMGCKALNESEVARVLVELTNKRDKLMFLIGLRTGFRISELLSLKVSDLVFMGQVKDIIKVSAKSMKGKKASRSIPVHNDVKNLVKELLTANTAWLTNPDHYLFKSPRGYNQPITRVTAHLILSQAYEIAEVTGQTGTHCMRKTFAKKVYNALNKDLLKTQKALGHRYITSTIDYLAVDMDEVNAAILS